MTISEINLNGLEDNYYYFLNPILVQIDSGTKFLTTAEVTLTNNSALSFNGSALKTQTFELQSDPKGVILFDISEYIKTIAVYPNGYRSFSSDNEIPNSINDIFVSISVFSLSSSEEVKFNFTKYFVFGGSEGSRTNVPALNLNLNQSVTNIDLERINIPYYKYSREFIRNISLRRFNLNGGSILITSENENNISFKDYVHTEGCKDVLVRFLNSKGGYNYFVFDNYTSSVKTSIKGDRVRINNFTNRSVISINKRNESEREYTLITEVKQRHKTFVEDLISSQYVCVLFPNSFNFVEVELTNNSSPDTLDSNFDFSISFKELNSRRQ